MLRLVPLSQYQDSINKHLDTYPAWDSIAMISWSSEDQHTANYYRLKVTTRDGEFLSKLTFFSMVADDQGRLKKMATEYELHPNHPAALGLPTLFAINKAQLILSEIQLYPVGQKERTKERTQFIVNQQPLVMKSHREKVYQGLHRKLRELYDSREFRDVKALYPDREEHQLLGQYIRVQHELQKQLMNQLEQELESQMVVGSPTEQEGRRPYGGYNQSNDPLYGYPREEFEFGSQSPQYSISSPVYEPRYDSDEDDITI